MNLSRLRNGLLRFLLGFVERAYNFLEQLVEVGENAMLLYRVESLSLA